MFEIVDTLTHILTGSAVAWWLMPRTQDPEVGGLSPTWVKLCCVLEQGTFTAPKVLVIPRKRWLLEEQSAQDLHCLLSHLPLCLNFR